MSFLVTAYSVRIASPGDAGMESILAREVMAGWNARKASGEKRVLVPLEGCANGEDALQDMLVAFLGASPSLPDGPVSRETALSIERYLQASRPTLIYLSGARVGFAPGHVTPGEELTVLKARYGSRAIVDGYGDEKEFRAKFTRDLDVVLASHAWFREEKVAPEFAVPEPVKEMSPLARTLLIEACDDFEAYLSRLQDGNTLKIQVNGKQLVEPGDPAAAIRWGGAFEEILSAGYIRDLGLRGQLFQVTPVGFDYLKSIGKTPVGYIAEMSGI